MSLDGKPMTVPTVPWLQTFEPGERVRVVAEDTGMRGEWGTVREMVAEVVIVDVDHRTGPPFAFLRGALRPA